MLAIIIIIITLAILLIVFCLSASFKNAQEDPYSSTVKVPNNEEKLFNKEDFPIIITSKENVL